MNMDCRVHHNGTRRPQAGVFYYDVRDSPYSHSTREKACNNCFVEQKDNSTCKILLHQTADAMLFY